MSYQALLFCPDEKTARTVTQVLGELDFSVVPCTEPFAAVKKLMGERFDAVVVDCDNEQNATLLFKSARSAPTNQGALAVAVVEGQAGVAKAFRIGANLVLTKPINVEQAKGTLRVARGLLRKNDGAKGANPAAAAITTPKPSAPAPAPAKPAPRAVVPTRTEAPSPVGHVEAPPVIPGQRPVSQPTIAASVPINLVEAAESEASPASIEETGEKFAQIPSQPVAASARSSAPQDFATTSAPAAPTRERQSSSGFAATAPAPAREPKPRIPVENKLSDHASPVKDEPAEKAYDASFSSTHTLTFGGTVGGTAKPAAGGGSKKLLVAVVVVLIAAAGGYAAWTTKWNPLQAIVPARTAARPATAPVATPAVAPAAANPINASPASGGQTSATETPETETPETPAPAKIAKATAHPDAVMTAPEAKPATSAPPQSKPVASSAPPAPMVIKNDHPKAAPKPEETADAPALSITATAPAGEPLPNLMGPSDAPTPVLQKLVVSQGVSRGLLVKEVQPIYPRSAIEMHVEGAVQLMATISKTGDISDTEILSGDKQLARAAVEAVKQWKYKPYLLNGEPVDIQTQITVNFKLPQH
jgi:periplasmic protein TonB